MLSVRAYHQTVYSLWACGKGRPLTMRLKTSTAEREVNTFLNSLDSMGESSSADTLHLSVNRVTAKFLPHSSCSYTLLA